MIFLLNTISEIQYIEGRRMKEGSRYECSIRLPKNVAELVLFLCSIDVQYGKCDSRYFTSSAIFRRDKYRQRSWTSIQRTNGRTVGRFLFLIDCEFYEISVSTYSTN